MILTIVLAISGGVGFCIACAAGGCCESVDVDGKPGGDDVEARARGGADDLPPPPPKHWSPEERQQLSLAVSSLPPSGLRDVRAIVGGDETTFEVAAPAGSLGVSISRRCTLGEVRASGPLAGRVAVGDRLVSISTPGRALFTCGPTATGLAFIDELRAGAGSDGRVLTFARVDFASLDVSVCDRLQRHVDAQPPRCGPRTCLCGAPKNLVCVVSGILLVCVVPATCGFLYFGFHCFADLYGATT